MRFSCSIIKKLTIVHICDIDIIFSVKIFRFLPKFVSGHADTISALKDNKECRISLNLLMELHWWSCPQAV
jgi:hypothetical protein